MLRIGAMIALEQRSIPSGSSAGALCDHCGLGVPEGRLDDSSARQFCCAGCQTVFEVLHQAGLDDYYRLPRADARPAQPSGKSHRELDDPALRAACCRPLPGGLMAAELHLEGVHCSACVWLVERMPLVVPGAVRSTLDLESSVVEVVFNPAEVELSAIARALDSFGYSPHPRHDASRAERDRREDRALLVRIGVAGAAAGNAMLMAFALYGGAFSGIEARHETLLRVASLAVTTPAVLFSGATFFRGAWAALRTRTAHVDLPLAIGILAGFVHGAAGTLRGTGDIYFDSITMLIFLLLVGRFVERRQTRKARETASLLHSLAPASARRVRGEIVEDVPVSVLSVNDLVEVHATEPIPVDGVVVSGSSSVDASLLSGEPLPTEVAPGSIVHAGCLNLSSVLRVRAAATGAETRVGQLLESVARAARRRAPIVRLADRVAGRFVVVILSLSVLTFAGWWYFDPSSALDHTIALLVVSCPCALGMATPLAVSATLGRAAQRGILVKGGDALEALARPCLIVFDKTGTLTRGRLEMVAWEGDATLRPLVAAVEAGSAHPVARALHRALSEGESARVENVKQTLGAGIEASTEHGLLIVGSPAFASARGATLGDRASEACERHALLGRTPVVVALDGQVKAVAALADPLRPDAVESLAKLRAMGHELGLLSGDHPLAVAAVAGALGPLAFAHGGVSPEDKLAFIERAARRASVVMVGDGVNDAAALSAASVGIAVHGGAEASLAAARVFTTREGLEPIVELTSAARRTLNVIRRGIGFSLTYNLIGVSLAIAGILNPLLAAILMPISSLTVVTNAYRSKVFR